MAKAVVCAIRDRAMECFGTPMFFGALGAATRGFGDAVREQKVMREHAEQFAIYHLGYYDDQSGKLLPLESPQLIAEAAIYVPELNEVVTTDRRLPVGVVRGNGGDHA